jgi:integrase
MKLAIKIADVRTMKLPTGTTASGKPVNQSFLWDTVVPGFGVRCTLGGKKSFVVQRRVNGVERRVTIGEFGIWTLDQAREEARSLLRDMDRGVDPIHVKKEKAKARAKEDALAITLKEVAADYCAHKKTKHGHLSERHKQDIERHIDHNFNEWADKPVREIKRNECVKLFEQLSKRAPAQANQAFVILRALLNWARDTHVTDDGQYQILAVNPVKLMFKTRAPNPERARETRVPEAKVGAVWHMLQGLRDSDHNLASTCTTADLVSFLLLTGCRWSEGAELMWSQVLDLDGETPSWHLPDPKNHRPITIPLCSAAVALLKARPKRKGCPYVFPSRSPGNGHAKDARATMEAVSRVAGLHLTPHDLRRTFIAVGHTLSIEMWRIELLTGHVPSTVTLRNYTETSDLRYLAPDIERIGTWIVAQGAVAQMRAEGTNVIQLAA